MFNATNSNDFISKSKTIFSIFFWISKIYKKFRILSKNSRASEVISLRNYWLGKAELLKCAKKTRVKTLMDSQHFKGSETLLKSARQCLCYIFLSLWQKIIPKISFLEVSEILRLFVSMLTPDDNSSLSVKASV